MSLTLGLLTFILLPLFWVLLDVAAAARARNKAYTFGGNRLNDYTILVPIWGDVRYLENVAYLGEASGNVLLCTTGEERDAFYAELERLASSNGFGIYRDPPTRA